MKKILLFLIFCLSFVFLQAQTSAIEYISTITDLDGNPLSSQSITLHIKILQNAANGTVVYEEDHSIETGPNGQVILDIGLGENANSSFEDVDWSYPNYVELLIDRAGGNNFETIKTTELLSVPYALFALNVDCQRTCMPIEGNSGAQGFQGAVGAQGLQGPSGIDGADGADGLKGVTGISGAESLTATNNVPINPESGRFYLDDGSNRSDGNVGIRYFNGSIWLDL